MLLDSLSTTATAATGSSPASSRRSSLGNIFHNSSTQLTPVLLSESTTSCSYFEHDERLSSSSETCEASAAPTAATSFDNTSYKIKNDRSSRKLDHFFGERIPRDVSVREIQREGLKVMLQSKIPLCYFLYHLLEEYSSENLVRKNIKAEEFSSPSMNNKKISWHAWGIISVLLYRDRTIRIVCVRLTCPTTCHRSAYIQYLSYPQLILWS